MGWMISSTYDSPLDGGCSLGNDPVSMYPHAAIFEKIGRMLVEMFKDNYVRHTVNLLNACM